MLGFQNKGGPQQSQRPTAALVIRPALAAPGGATVRPEGPQRLRRPAGALVSVQLWRPLGGVTVRPIAASSPASLQGALVYIQCQRPGKGRKVSLAFSLNVILDDVDKIP